MQVQCSNDVYVTFKPVMAKKKFEHFMIALLDNKNRIVRKVLVGMGTTNECQVEPLQVFHFAIKHALPRIILVHNHPSNDTTPSPHDVALTRRLIEGATILGLSILDHVIIGKTGYTSLRDIGVIYHAQ